MTLGIRRDTDDIDGKKYLATKIINEQIFAESADNDGTVKNFNKAAGLEH